ncbi:MAG: transporter [Rubripirellula sp.]
MADKHAPAGIMGDHLHERGKWMVEYKYMNMYMEDNAIGETSISDEAAIGPAGGSPGIVVDGIQTNAGASPTQMTMEMHMMHVMYGATDDVTLYTMLMLPSLTMDHLRGDANPAGRGSEFTTHNSGFGDTNLGALMRLASDEDEDLIFNLGCSVPTGDIYRESTAPTGGAASQPLPYPMRLGSGTFNFRPGMTYKKYYDWWSWGAQVQADLPIGRNYRGYSVGDEFRLNSWTSVLLTDWLSVSWRGEHVFRSSYDGADPAATDLLISTNVESFRGGYWYNAGFGAQALIKDSLLNMEIIPNIHQDVDGIQLETDYAFAMSWSKAW